MCLSCEVFLRQIADLGAVRRGIDFAYPEPGRTTMKNLVALLCVIALPFAISAVGCGSAQNPEQAQVTPRPSDPPPRPIPEPPQPQPPRPPNTGDPAPDAAPHN
jgi:hypothetical protein